MIHTHFCLLSDIMMNTEDVDRLLFEAIVKRNSMSGLCRLEERDKYQEVFVISHCLCHRLTYVTKRQSSN